jgi:hypothetical protein
MTKTSSDSSTTSSSSSSLSSPPSSLIPFEKYINHQKSFPLSAK